MKKPRENLPVPADTVPHEIVAPLLSWYDESARILPWRENPEPYRVWISEIMLQQTRVEAAKPYYDRFLEELPDVSALACVPEEQLMKLWEGLGYYNRARNLQKAAKVLMEKHSGQLPASFEALLELPGFGEYTAGAVSSIAFGIRVPAVDGNVLRVISRILGSREDVTRPDVKRSITEGVRQILPERVGDFNQALMELGAMVCLPNGAPRCDICPEAFLCEGYRQGIMAQLPVKPEKKARKIQQRTVWILVAQDGEGISRVALHKRDESGLLAGLWEFPNAEGMLSPAESRRRAAEWGLVLRKQQTLEPAKHIFSHIEWRMTGYLASLAGVPEKSDFFWADSRQLEKECTVPSAFKAYLAEAMKALNQSD